MTTAARMKRLDRIERQLTERDNATHLVLIERTSDDAPPEIDTGVVLRPGRPSVRLERLPDEPQEAFLNRCRAAV